MDAPRYASVRQSDAADAERRPRVSKAKGQVLSVSEGRSFASQGQNKRPREKQDKTPATA